MTKKALIRACKARTIRIWPCKGKYKRKNIITPVYNTCPVNLLFYFLIKKQKTSTIRNVVFTLCITGNWFAFLIIQNEYKQVTNIKCKTSHINFAYIKCIRHCSNKWACLFTL